jgi:LytR cell envelope-related transcriptional attenuator
VQAVNALPLALSLTSTFTKVGAIAGFAALLGIALLSLLAFAQAREIKRLREWAGRAPERAAEMEQRVSTEAAARLQRAGGPSAPAVAGVAGAAGARVVPRKTPLVSAPVSTAVNATVAAGKIGAQPDPTAADPAKSAVPDPAVAGQVTAGGPAQANPGAGGAAQPSAVPVDGALGGAVQPASSQPNVSPAAFPLPGSPITGVGQPPANGVGSPEAPPADVQDQSATGSPQGNEQSAAAPATAAARAAVPPPRSPLPPSPSAPMPPGVPASTVAGAAAAVPLAAAAVGAGQTVQPEAPRPPAPVAAARPVASRAVASPLAPTGTKGEESGARKSVSPRARGEDAGSGAAAERMPAPVGSGPKYFKQERSSGRTTLLILGGVVLGVAVIVLAVSALKGGSKPSPTASQPPTPSTVAHTRTPTPATNPSELTVAVLNGTSTNGLAHHLADDLQQSGYKRAEASSAVPSGTHATTVVQYTTGHRVDGQAVAKALDVTRVQPMEGSTASLVSHATVIVVAGADQAAQLGGAGTQGSGEAASGTSGQTGSGEGTAGSGQ